MGGFIAVEYSERSEAVAQPVVEGADYGRVEKFAVQAETTLTGLTILNFDSTMQELLEPLDRELERLDGPQKAIAKSMQILAAAA